MNVFDYSIISGAFSFPFKTFKSFKTFKKEKCNNEHDVDLSILPLTGFFSY